MYVGKTLFAQVMEFVPRTSFTRIVQRHAGDSGARTLRISAIVDARFSLIVDGKTASSRVRRRGAQAPGWNVAQASTISLKRHLPRVVLQPVLGLS